MNNAKPVKCVSRDYHSSPFYLIQTNGIKFKKLQDINVDALEATIRDGIKYTTQQL